MANRQSIHPPPAAGVKSERPVCGATAGPEQSGFQSSGARVVLSRDGLVYVCDRANNRIQVFSRDGEFRHQLAFDPATRGNGAIWAMALSADREQRFLFYADGENNFVRIVNRQTAQALDTFGTNGRNAGQFHWIHQLVIDSLGNIYTGEVDTGKRIQKFVPR